MASEIKVDTISEKTSAGGVTIDGLLIKDGNISGDVALAGTTPTFTIGDAGAEDAALVFDGNAQDFYIALDDSADDLLIGLGSTVGTTPAISIDENLAIKTYGDITMTGTTPVLTIGDAGAEDTAIVFDGNAQDYHIGLDDSADTLVLGLGSTLGTTPAMTVNSSQVVTFAQNPVFPDGGVAVADLDIDGATDIGAAIVDADLFIIDDGAGGTNRKTAASRVKTYVGGGITHASYWRLSVALQGDAVPISSNWEEYDDASYERIGSAMTESSGVFTFPETGKWRIHFFAEQTTDSNFAGGTSASRGQWEISLTQNTGSSWDAQAVCTGFGGDTSGAQGYVTVSCEALFDVTSTSTHKCRFSVDQIDGNNYTMGNSSTAYTGMAFVRYGDT